MNLQNCIINKLNAILNKQFFGTDGIRGEVGQYPITPAFMLQLGWAVGQVFSESADASTKPYFLIGKDTRLSGYMFESALEAGLSAAGADVLLCGPMPTPAIAYLTRTFRAQAGFVISASHNPHHDNGIKLFSSKGAKFDDQIELKIEEWLGKPMSVVAPHRLGKARRIEDSEGRYIEFCKASFARSLSLKGLKIVVDCAQGATYRVGPIVFEELGAHVTRMHADPDGLNINLSCGSTHPDLLRATVVAEKAHLGIAFDGDGDRVIMVDHLGHVIDGDTLLYIIARHQCREKPLTGVVGTQMSNLGFERAIKDLGLGFERAQVGDRYVLEQLQRTGWLLGGESSGHLICLEHTTTGDAIIAALQVLQALLLESETLHQASVALKKYPQVMINVKVADKQQAMTHERVLSVLQEAEAAMGDSESGSQGRVLLRPSGTEPVVRVMLEGENEQMIQAWAEKIAETVRSVCSNVAPESHAEGLFQ